MRDSKAEERRATLIRQTASSFITFGSAGEASWQSQGQIRIKLAGELGRPPFHTFHRILREASLWDAVARRGPRGRGP